MRDERRCPAGIRIQTDLHRAAGHEFPDNGLGHGAVIGPAGGDIQGVAAHLRPFHSGRLGKSRQRALHRVRDGLPAETKRAVHAGHGREESGFEPCGFHEIGREGFGEFKRVLEIRRDGRRFWIRHDHEPGGVGHVFLVVEDVDGDQHRVDAFRTEFGRDGLGQAGTVVGDEHLASLGQNDRRFRERRRFGERNGLPLGELRRCGGCRHGLQGAGPRGSPIPQRGAARRFDRRHGESGGGRGKQLDDLTQSFEATHVFGGDRGQAGGALLEGREDFDALDGIDAEVRLDVHVQAQHLHGVAGQLAHHGEQGGMQRLAFADAGFRRRDGGSGFGAGPGFRYGLPAAEKSDDLTPEF